MKKYILAAAAALVMVSTVQAAEETTAVGVQAKPPTESSKDANTFGGIKFGTGLAAGFRRSPIVTNAAVVGGVVRVSEETTAVARLILESHYLFTCEDKSAGKVCGDNLFKSSGHGPFVAIQPGQADIIQSIGIGWMLAFRHNDTDTSSWNIGLGVMVDPKVKTLGDGIVANQPLPVGETQVRFKTTARYSWFLMSSYAF